MSNAAVVITGGIVAGLAFLLFYSRKATADEKDTASIDLNWKPIDLGNLTRPYYNPNSDEGSKMINNPLNIKWNASNNWLGQKGKNARGFVVFDEAKNCYRAGARILLNYAKRGIDTIPEIINAWAPPSDNNPVESYINFVCNKTGFSRTKQITRSDYVDLLIAMTQFEIGSFPYTRAVVQNGVGAA